MFAKVDPCHVPRAYLLNRALREKFVRIYSEPILQNFLNELGKKAFRRGMHCLGEGDRGLENDDDSKESKSMCCVYHFPVFRIVPVKPSREQLNGLIFKSEGEYSIVIPG